MSLNVIIPLETKQTKSDEIDATLACVTKKKKCYTYLKKTKARDKTRTETVWAMETEFTY